MILHAIIIAHLLLMTRNAIPSTNLDLQYLVSYFAVKADSGVLMIE